jgi:hypothetical protein
MSEIMCKPIPNCLSIEGGSWEYVVVNRHTNKIVAAFTNDIDAEQYVQQCAGPFYIREVED